MSVSVCEPLSALCSSLGPEAKPGSEKGARKVAVGRRVLEVDARVHANESNVDDSGRKQVR